MDLEIMGQKKMNGSKVHVHGRLEQSIDLEYERLPLRNFQTIWFKELRKLLAKELSLFILLVNYNFWFLFQDTVENK